jgi:tetratricopeptide (TPR) repeat protein
MTKISGGITVSGWTLIGLLLSVCLFIPACAMPRFLVLSDPLTAQEHNDLGVSYELMGKSELALTAYQRAFRKDKKWDQPLINHGNVHASSRDWGLAEASYRNALKRNPANPETMNNLAYVLMEQGKDQQALSWSQKAVAIAPENPAFLNTYARALKKTANQDKTTEITLDTLDENSADGSSGDETEDLPREIAP